jgi:hypothetical protein
MSDGKSLFFYTEDPYVEFKDKKWKPVTIKDDHSKLKGVTRLATNADNTKLAIVVSE